MAAVAVALAVALAANMDMAAAALAVAVVLWLSPAKRSPSLNHTGPSHVAIHIPDTPSHSFD